MVTIEGSALIERPPEVVYDFVATPTNWPLWYPITRSVDVLAGESGSPAKPGTRVREKVRVAGIPFTFLWWFVDSVAPRAVSYYGSAQFWGGLATISYRFLPEEVGGAAATRFERRLVYVQTNPLTQFGDWILLRKRFRTVSDEAVATAKALLEDGSL